jgi:hypothetical protein
MTFRGYSSHFGYGEPAPAPRACNNARIPTLDPIVPFTRGRIFGRCADTGVFGVADPTAVLTRAVARALEMLDNTIGELTNARARVCAGDPPAWPIIGDITAHWLRNRLSVCIDDIGVWTAGTFVNRSVAEVIRRLARVRNLIASNGMLYICNGRECEPGDWAFVFVNRDCVGTNASAIRLCRAFWVPEPGVDAATHAEFQAQTIIHEASHLYHCTSDARGRTIGVAECLAQFVAETNGSPVDPDFAARCATTNACAGGGVHGYEGMFGSNAPTPAGREIRRVKFRTRNAVRPKGRLVGRAAQRAAAIR